MSERAEKSVDNRSLLMEMKAEELEAGAVRDALIEYQRIIDLLQTEEEQLRALNQVVMSLHKAENRDSTKISRYQNDAKACANRINSYDRQLLALEASEALQPLLKGLKKKAYKEAVEQGKKVLEEYRQRAVAEQERKVREWREKREQGARRRQIGAIEAEIAQAKKEAQAIHEAIAALGGCWFGKKQKEKKRLEAELKKTQNRLMYLHNTRNQLKSGNTTINLQSKEESRHKSAEVQTGKTNNTSTSSSGLKSPKVFYTACVEDFHKEAIKSGAATKGLIFIPELIPLGEKTILAFLQDTFFQRQFGDNAQLYYYAIMSLVIDAGIVYATCWHENFSGLNNYVERIISEGPADHANILLEKHFPKSISENQGNPFFQKIYTRWVAMHHPYWALSDPREYTFSAMLAAYQLGISMILEKYGY